MSTFTTLGSEFRVNTTTANIQKNSSVAGLSSGGFVVVWTSSSGAGDNILGQIYNASGATVGGELPIAAITGVNENLAEVSALGTGFVVAYDAPNAPLFHPNSVWTETFDSAGNGAGEVEAEIGNNQGHAAVVAASTLGGFLTVWDDSGVGPDADQGAIRTGVNGGGGLTVNTTTAGDQRGSTVAALQDGTGRYVAAWTENDGVGPHEIRGQILSSAGAKIGGEFSFDADVGSPSGKDKDIAARPGGGYAIAYADSFNTHVKVFDGANALVADFNANTPFVNEGGDLQAVAALSNGLLAVAWREFSLAQFSILKVFAPDGTQVGATVNLQAGGGSGIVTDPSIAALANGQFVVTWTDNRATLADPDTGITGRRFSTSAPVLQNGTAADDTFNGAATTRFFLGYFGFDTVTYASAPGPVTVNLANPALNTGAAAGDEFGISVERIVGSNFNDTLTGNGLDNVLEGGGGNDTLAGAGGVDGASYSGATSGVTVSLATAGAQNTGGAGTDTLSGFENLFGSDFNDTLTGDAGDNEIHGLSGSDVLNGADGNDTLLAGPGLGNDTLNGGNGVDTVDFSGASGPITANFTIAGAQNTGEGFDTFSGIENLIGSGFADTFTGQFFDNRFDGAGGADTLRGGSGNDTLNGDAGADLLVGDFGNDTIDGGADGDRLYGGTSDDQLFGGAGGDTLSGGPGNDRLDGGDGFDRLYGDTTADTFVFNTLAGVGDRVFGFRTAVHKLEFDISVFNGTLGPFAFVANTNPSATTAQQTFLHDTDGGFVYFDRDGVGGVGPLYLLTLYAAPALAAGDIVLV